MIPPKLNVETNLDEWKNSLQSVKQLLEADDGTVAKYNEWISSQQRKVAPGFNFEGTLTPTKKAEGTTGTAASPTVPQPSATAELDSLFGKVSI